MKTQTLIPFPSRDLKGGKNDVTLLRILRKPEIFYAYGSSKLGWFIRKDHEKGSFVTDTYITNKQFASDFEIIDCVRKENINGESYKT